MTIISQSSWLLKITEKVEAGNKKAQALLSGGVNFNK